MIRGASGDVDIPGAGRGVKCLSPRREELHELVIGMGLQGALERASEIEHLRCPHPFYLACR